jgi:hypothetical protein
MISCHLIVNHELVIEEPATTPFISADHSTLTRFQKQTRNVYIDDCLFYKL